MIHPTDDELNRLIEKIKANWTGDDSRRDILVWLDDVYRPNAPLKFLQCGCGLSPFREIDPIEDYCEDCETEWSVILIDDVDRKFLLMVKAIDRAYDGLLGGDISVMTRLAEAYRDVTGEEIDG